MSLRLSYSALLFLSSLWLVQQSSAQETAAREIPPSAPSSRTDSSFPAVTTHKALEETLAQIRSLPANDTTKIRYLLLLMRKEYYNSIASVPRVAQELLPLAKATRDTNALVECYAILASTSGYRGRRSEAFQYYEQALSFVRSGAATARRLSVVYDCLTDLYRLTLRYDSAYTAAQEALRYALKTNDSLLMARAWYNLGQVLVRTRRYNEATELFYRALPLFQKSGQQAEYLMTLSSLGYVSGLKGKWEEAIPLYNSVISSISADDFAFLHAEAHNALGMAMFHLQRYTEAIPHLETAFERAMKLDEQILKEESSLYLSKTYEALRQPEQALRYYKEFVRVIQSTDNLPKSSTNTQEIARYEQLLKDQQILLLQREAANERYKQMLIIGIAVILFGLIAGIIFFWRRRLAKIAQQRDEELQIFSSYTNDLITRHDYFGRCLYVSPAIDPLLGYSVEEMMGENPSSYIHPDDVAGVREAYRNIVTTKTSGSYTVRFRAKNGSYRWLEANFKPLLDAKGDIKEFVQTARDVSQRIEAEQKLRASEEVLKSTLHNTPNVAVQWYNQQGEVVLWNRASEIMYGWSAEEAQGKTLDVLIHSPEEEEIFRASLQTIALTGDVIGPAEYHFRRKNGSKGVGESTVFAIPNALQESIEGKFLFVCMDVDITERKRAQSSLEQREYQLSAIINTTGDNIFSIDREYRFITLNASTIKNIRQWYDIEATPGMNALEIDPQSESLWRAWYDRAFQGEAFHVEHHFSRPADGIAEVSFNPIYTSERVIEGVAVFHRDISSRKQAEIALRNNEARMRSIVEAMSEGLLVQDEQHNILFANTALLTMLQANGADVYETTIFDQRLQNIHEDGTPFIDDERPSVIALRTGKPQSNVTMGIVRPDGHVLWLLINAYPIQHHPDEKPQSVVSTFTDITRMKQIELALRENEERLRSVLEAMSEGLIMQDINDAILFSNESAATILGLTQDQLHGRSSFDPDWRVVHEDGSPFLPDDRPSVTTLRTGKPTSGIIMGVYKPGGELAWISTNAQPIFRAGTTEPSSAVVTFYDVTEQKNAERALRESEERLRSIVGTLSEGLVLHNAAGQITFCNPAAAVILGVSEEELLRSSSLSFEDKTFHENGEPMAAHEHPAMATLATGRPYSGIVIGVRKSDDSLVWLSVNSRPLYTHNSSTPTAAVVTFIDITERRTTELLIQEQLRALEAKTVEMERFIYTVSHDLKSPLVTIKGFLGMVQEDVEAKEYDRIAEDLGRIGNAANRMQHLLEDLLELSRVGRVINPSETFSMTNLAAETVEILHGILAPRNIRVHVQPNMPSIFGDKARFREVYQNLIENASKFMGNQSEPRIDIGVRTDEESGEAIFFVQDNGIGIPEQYQEKIFGLFDKLDPKSDGTGIGLALVRRIIDLHGGKIWVESDAHGSTFCFTTKLVG